MTIFNNKKHAAMDTKSSIIFLILFGIVSIFVAAGINNFKEKTFNISYESVISRIREGITAMDIEGPDYFHSPLFSEEELEDYEQKPGQFIKETLGVTKYCGNSNGNCFAPKYKSENGQPYTPTYKGACAIIKGGQSICMIPQIKNKNISGIIDVTGQSGPNVFGKDLRFFEIQAKGSIYNPDDDQVGEVKVVAP